MKTRFLAATIAIWTTLFICVELFIIFYFFPNHALPLTILAVLLLFIFTYLLSRYWIRKEIYDKVRTIYKNIYSYKISKKSLKQKINKSTLSMDNVNEEVIRWMEDSNKEINSMIALEKFRKEYIGDIAHELKTPIFTIQGYVSTLLDGAMEDENLRQKYLTRADASIERMIAIIQDLDTISQLELGQMPLNITNFNIIPLIKDVIDNLELKAKERNVVVSFIQNVEYIFVKADKDKVRQLLVNLIENGIKYSKDSAGEVRVKIFDMEDQYLIEVSDKGIGIEEKDINRVFERFYRTDKARSRQYGGTGLGLAIVKHIVEAHNQTINVRSKFGEGTVFGFTLERA